MSKSGFQIHVQIEGIPASVLCMKNMEEVAGRSLAKSLYQEGEIIMGQSKKLVPVKDGNLISSGHVQLPKRMGKSGWLIEIGYGGPSAPYALVQHENLWYKHPGGRIAKYLERPALSVARTMGRRVSKKLHAALVAAGMKRGR